MTMPNIVNKVHDVAIKLELTCSDKPSALLTIKPDVRHMINPEAVGVTKDSWFLSIKADGIF